MAEPPRGRDQALLSQRQRPPLWSWLLQPARVTSLFVHLILGTDNITRVEELRFGEQEPDFLQSVSSRGIPLLYLPDLIPSAAEISRSCT